MEIHLTAPPLQIRRFSLWMVLPYASWVQSLSAITAKSSG